MESESNHEYKVTRTDSDDNIWIEVLQKDGTVKEEILTYHHLYVSTASYLPDDEFLQMICQPEQEVSSPTIKGLIERGRRPVKKSNLLTEEDLDWLKGKMCPVCDVQLLKLPDVKGGTVCLECDREYLPVEKEKNNDKI